MPVRPEIVIDKIKNVKEHKMCDTCGRILACPTPDVFGNGKTIHAWCPHFGTPNQPKKVHVYKKPEGNIHVCDPDLETFER